MLQRLRQWPGPGGPLLTEAAAFEAGCRVLASIRPHPATVRARTMIPLLLSLATPIPVLLGSLPTFMLLPVPIMWLLMPSMLRNEWLATQTTFCLDRLLVRQGQSDKQPVTIVLAGLGRIDATQDPIQARTGSCTLHFVQVTENPDDPQQPFMTRLHQVGDVETQAAQNIMAAYQASLLA